MWGCHDSTDGLFSKINLDKSQHILGYKLQTSEECYYNDTCQLHYFIPNYLFKAISFNEEFNNQHFATYRIHIE